MKKACFEEALRLLANERAQRPERSDRDDVKFLFQALLGPGHLLDDTERARAWLEREMNGTEPDGDEPLIEPLSSIWCRVNLRPAKALGIAPERILALMIEGEPGAVYARSDVQRLYALFTGEQMREVPAPDILKDLSDPGFVPSHSERYRGAYRPSYRVVPLRRADSLTGGAQPMPSPTSMHR